MGATAGIHLGRLATAQTVDFFSLTFMSQFIVTLQEVLFTYVTKSVLSYLESNYDEDETKQDIDALRAQVR